MLEIWKYALFLHKNSLNWLMDKRQRLGVIRRLIESERISSQEQLLEALGKNGVSVNQSTLSRDLHFLNIIKAPDGEGGYVYRFVETPARKTVHRISSVISENVQLMGFSGNIAVIKTMSGYANAMGALVDANNFPEILGTIAGDDTLFILLKEGVAREEFVESVKRIFPYLNMPAS